MRRFGLALVLVLGFALQASAFSNTVLYKSVHGNDRVAYGYMTFDSSYPSGGEAASLSTLSEGYIFHTMKFLILSPTGGYSFSYNATTGKVLVYQTASAGTHTHTITVTNTSTGTAVKITAGSLKVSGNSTSITTNSATITAAAFAPVPDGTNLSALSQVPYMLFGI